MKKLGLIAPVHNEAAGIIDFFEEVQKFLVLTQETHGHTL
jgi:hypothetical protein